MMTTNINRTAQGLMKCVALNGMVLLVLMSGCAGTTRPADFILTGFDCTSVQSVAVLPVLDLRIDQSSKLDLDDIILPIAESTLENRGYSPNLQKDRALLANVTGDDLDAPTRDFIASLPPASSRWVLVLALNNSSSSLTFGSTGTAEVSGYLFDKDSGQLVWREKEVGQAGQGGLLGMAMIAMMESQAIQQATMKIFGSLPYCKK